MARKIVDKLFEKVEESSTEKNDHFISLEDWKNVVSRLDRTQIQVEACQEKMNLMYSKVMQWLNLIREKLETVSKTQKEMDLETKNTFKLLEEKVLNWVQPDKRKEEQRRVMGLMQRHSQFIQSYDKQVHSIKGALSKNEYQIYQLLEQIRVMRIEMNLMNQPQNTPSSPNKKRYPDLNLSP